MIRVTSRGDFNKTRSFIQHILNGDILNDLGRFGRLGVNALARATPVETGLTRDSWDYRIIRDKSRTTIEWYNTNTVNGTPVVIMLQYGHGTGSGGYVVGRDFINPTIQPIFDQIADDVWKKVNA